MVLTKFFPAPRLSTRLCLVLLSIAIVNCQICGIPRLPQLQGNSDPPPSQSPTNPSEYGRCIQIDSSQMNSHWCKDLGLTPDGPSDRAKSCLKFGRMSVYRGPIGGNGPSHKGACNVELVGSDDAALVAVSTKYLPFNKGGWQSDQGACGQCLCMRIHGVDSNSNSGPDMDQVRRRIGSTFKARVGDRCGECADDQVDVLQDRPFSYAPKGGDQPNADTYNRIPGPRVFGDASMLSPGPTAPEHVGVWTADWQWVPCSYTHEQCAELMRNDGGYQDSRPPSCAPGLDVNGNVVQSCDGSGGNQGNQNMNTQPTVTQTGGNQGNQNTNSQPTVTQTGGNQNTNSQPTVTQTGGNQGNQFTQPSWTQRSFNTGTQFNRGTASNFQSNFQNSGSGSSTTNLGSGLRNFRFSPRKARALAGREMSD